MSELADQSGSVSRDLLAAREGPQQADAQARLFNRYYDKVVDRARRRLGKLAVVDASDVAVSVWDTLFRRLREGTCLCNDRVAFEELLGKITYHKAVNLYNWIKRSQRHPSRKLETEEIIESFPLDESHRQVAELYYLLGKTEPEIAATLQISLEETQQRLRVVRRWLQKYRYRPVSPIRSESIELASVEESPLEIMLFGELILSLDEKLRETVLMKLEGFDNRYIAEQLNVTERQVQRRLQLLRRLLTAEANRISNPT